MPEQVMIDRKHLENAEYGMIKNDARCTLETKARIFMEKADFSERKILFFINCT